MVETEAGSWETYFCIWLRGCGCWDKDYGNSDGEKQTNFRQNLNIVLIGPVDGNGQGTQGIKHYTRVSGSSTWVASVSVNLEEESVGRMGGGRHGCCTSCPQIHDRYFERNMGS